jgi:hypothetical protein
MEDGTSRPPTPNEVTARVENLIGPELLFICKGETDEKVIKLYRPAMEAHSILYRAIA